MAGPLLGEGGDLLQTQSGETLFTELGMAVTLRVSGTKTCEGGIEIRLSINGQPYSEGMVFESLAAAINAVDDNPMTIDDLLWVIRRCAKAQNLTQGQIAARTLTVDFNSPTPIRFEVV